MIYNIWQNFFEQCDAPRPWGMYFQDSASPQMEALVELHDNILFYLIIILFAVGWILTAIVVKFIFRSWLFYIGISLLTLTCAGVLTMHSSSNASYFLLLPIIIFILCILLPRKAIFNLVFFLFLIVTYSLLGSSIYPDFVLTQDYVLIVDIFFISVMITNYIFSEKKVSIIEKFSNLLSNRLIIKKYIIDHIYSILFIIAFLIIIGTVSGLGYIHFTGFKFEDSFFLHFKKILFQYGFMSIFLGCLFSKYTTGKWQLSKSLDNITITRFALILLSYTIFIYNGLIYEIVPIILTLASDSLLSIITVLANIFKLHSLFHNLFHIISHSSIRIGNFASSYYSHYGYTFSKFTVTRKIDYSFMIKQSNLIRGLLFGELKYKLVDSMPTKYSNSSVFKSWYISDTISNQRLSDKLFSIKCKGNLDLSKIQVITRDQYIFIYIPLKGRCVFISTNSSIIKSINGVLSNNKITSSTSNLNNKVSPCSPNINQVRLLDASDTEYSLYSDINNTIENSLDLNIYNTPENIPVFNKPLPISVYNKPLPLNPKDLLDRYDFSAGFPLHNFRSEPIIILSAFVSITYPLIDMSVPQVRACPVVELGPMPVRTCISLDFNKLAMVECLRIMESEIINTNSDLSGEDYYFFVKNCKSIKDDISSISDTLNLITECIKGNNLICCFDDDDDKSYLYPYDANSSDFLDTIRHEITVHAEGLIRMCTCVYLTFNCNKRARSLINILYIELVLNNGIIGNGEFHDLYTKVKESWSKHPGQERFLYLDNYPIEDQNPYRRNLTIPGVFDTNEVLIWGEPVEYNLEQELAIRNEESKEIYRLREILSFVRENLPSRTFIEVRNFGGREDLHNTFTQIIYSLDLPRSKTNRYGNFEFISDKIEIMSNYKKKVDIATINLHSKDTKFVEMRALEYYLIVLNQGSRTRYIRETINIRIANIIEKLCKEYTCPYTNTQSFGYRIGVVLQKRINFLREQLNLY